MLSSITVDVALDTPNELADFLANAADSGLTCEPAGSANGWPMYKITGDGTVLWAFLVAAGYDSDDVSESIH